QVSGLEDFDKIRPPAYRVALKLESLQNICRSGLNPGLFLLCVLHFMPCSLAQVTQRLNGMFRSASPEFADRSTAEPTEKLCSLIFRMFDSFPFAFIQKCGRNADVINKFTEGQVHCIVCCSDESHRLFFFFDVVMDS
uniref:Uncharacterized protein n=1 Tax=Hippocampus comes TaxID=109280 RepID=A0A3Q3D3K2_HIPCM